MSGRGFLYAWFAVVALGCSEPARVPAAAAAKPAFDPSTRAFPLLAWAARDVSEHYFERRRFDPARQIEVALDHLEGLYPELLAERHAEAITLTAGARHTKLSLAGLKTLAEGADRLDTALAFAADALELSAETRVEFEYAAVTGYLLGLDPHTVLLTPKQNAELGVKTRGTFGGIGAEIVADRRRIRIARVLPDNPAAKAGVIDGDLILEIDGQSTVNLPLVEAQQRLRGPVGTKVTIKVRRASGVHSLTIERATVRLESVTHVRLPEAIGYVAIASFSEDTGERVREALAEMQGQPGGLRGLVLDVRHNSGGLLTQAATVADLFVPEGELVAVHSADARETITAEKDMALPSETPVWVLVDQNSASASEIVAGTLQALGRAKVVGRESFGKGTVQMLRPQRAYGEEVALKLTVAEYRVAGDGVIQTHGVTPDVELLPIEPTGLDRVLRFFDRERFEAARERALLADHPAAHHIKGRVSRPQPLRLRYLSQARDVGDAPQVLRDPEVAMAAALVEQDARGEGITASVAALGRDAMETLVSALAPQGIDWSAAAQGQVIPGLELSVEVRAEAGAKNGAGEDAGRAGQAPTLRAGEPFVLRVAVRNTGEVAAHRVHLITDCPQQELDGIEVVLGRIDPGVVTVHDVRVQLMAWRPSLVDELRVDAFLGEPDDGPKASASARFEVQAQDPPQLAFRFWWMDDPNGVTDAPSRPEPPPLAGEAPFLVDGNADSKVQPGERGLLAVEVENLGPGKSPEVRALVRNFTGQSALLEEGSLDLGALEKDGRGRGAFGLTVRPEADPKTPLDLELTVGDGRLRTMVERRFDVDVSGASGWSRDEPLRVQGPRVELELPLRVDAEAVLASGAAEHPVGVRDVAVMVRPAGQARRTHKVLYVANAGEAKRQEFSATVPLEPGANRITVVARDRDDVTHRRDYWVYRGAEAADSSTTGGSGAGDGAASSEP